MFTNYLLDRESGIVRQLAGQERDARQLVGAESHRPDGRICCGDGATFRDPRDRLIGRDARDNDVAAGGRAQLASHVVDRCDARQVLNDEVGERRRDGVARLGESTEHVLR